MFDSVNCPVENKSENYGAGHPVTPGRVVCVPVGFWTIGLNVTPGASPRWGRWESFGSEVNPWIYFRARLKRYLFDPMSSSEGRGWGPKCMGLLVLLAFTCSGTIGQ